MQTIYTTPKPHNENTFFEKQLQYQTRKHSESKPLRSKLKILKSLKNSKKIDWNFEVRIENNALLKRMKEIKLKGTKTFQCLTDETPKNSKYGSFSKKTLNIDKRIRIIKNIMKENEVLSLKKKSNIAKFFKSS